MATERATIAEFIITFGVGVAVTLGATAMLGNVHYPIGVPKLCIEMKNGADLWVRERESKEPWFKLSPVRDTYCFNPRKGPITVIETAVGP